MIARALRVSRVAGYIADPLFSRTGPIARFAAHFGLLVVFVTLGAGGAACMARCGGDVGGCSCEPCGAAIRVQAFNAAGRELSLFSAAYTLNGDTLGEAANCFIEAIDAECGIFGEPCEGPMVCELGNQAGVYHVQVSAPGFAPREFVERLAQTASTELCCASCLQARTVNVILDEEESVPARTQSATGAALGDAGT